MIRCSYLLRLFHHCPAQPCEIRLRTPCKSCDPWPCWSVALASTHSSLCFSRLPVFRPCVWSQHSILSSSLYSLSYTGFYLFWAQPQWFPWQSSGSGLVVQTQMDTLSDAPMVVFIQEWFEDHFYTDYIAGGLENIRVDWIRTSGE